MIDKYGSVGLLLAAARRFAGINSVAFTFDGSGDSGSLGDMLTVNCGGVCNEVTPRELNIDLSRAFGVERSRGIFRLLRRDWPSYRYADDDDASAAGEAEGRPLFDFASVLETVAWEQVGAACPGWEINEGSQGGVTFYTSREAYADGDFGGIEERDDDDSIIDDNAAGEPLVVVEWQYRNEVPWTVEAMPDMATEIEEYDRLCERNLAVYDGEADAASFTKADKDRMYALADEISDASVAYEGENLSEVHARSWSFSFDGFAYAIIIGETNNNEEA